MERQLTGFNRRFYVKTVRIYSMVNRTRRLRCEAGDPPFTFLLPSSDVSTLTRCKEQLTIHDEVTLDGLCEQLWTANVRSARDQMARRNAPSRLNLRTCERAACGHGRSQGDRAL